jgi:two-component system cell cycle response regulator CtrA
MRVEIKDDDPRHTLSIDLDAKTVRIDDKTVRLCRLEYRLLDVLGWCAGTVVSREFIAMCLYGTLDDTTLNNVKTTAGRLRRDLSAAGGRNYIKCIRDAGYMLA